MCTMADRRLQVFHAVAKHLSFTTDHYFEKAVVAPDSLNVVMELGSPEALKGLVATGLRFAIISKAAVMKEIRLGQLVQIPLSPRLVRNLSVVYPKERFHSLTVTSFVSFAKARLTALAADQADPLSICVSASAPIGSP
jgi:DNA-binding transcriptional LysR family regulator